ncbi:phosphatase PAP2/dual specificity phosphatase family protein [Xenorhabdus sp. DI]|uniref:phosphatase PAP2/dual specificity phosphatase family protein n=1 Tax=Xenorhabdus doucetiae TaxID=351671 RepID=UPI0019A6568E|nr:MULTISPECIES: phosphatase PAP2/dual specificity phosphatase family protein [unclassified Xenorhabdus]MBD2785911.1 phosphatase PAP2/dual specificity phosphatase family protein [Xenorhabdus sp. 3]MBD2789568.1 phosphatase PAP2/dual specificity phosphatase family protein [Xenorhabdus sp. DI]
MKYPVQLPSESRQRLWLTAGVWLLFLAPFFFMTYGQVNQFTAQRNDMEVVVFSWEQNLPFWPWTIIPYWSIDLFYGISLFICTTRREQWLHGWRLVTASLIACAGFLLFPLKFSFSRPTTDGIFGWLFTQLERFDLPYNQAPSLHIILLWLLWLRYATHLQGYWRGWLHVWSALIALSVLTTWQHHFIDVITGFAVGVIISYLLPISHHWQWQPSQDRYARKLFGYYAMGSFLFTLMAYGLGGVFWILLWPAISLLMIALGYAGLGSTVLQKQPDGRMSLSARWLLAPYQLGAWLAYLWFRRQSSPYDQITEGIILGYLPRQSDIASINTTCVFDLTAEWHRKPDKHGKRYICQPQIDLLPLTPKALQSAVCTLDKLHQEGSVFVHCTLGLSRSAMVVAAWLLKQHPEYNVTTVVNILHKARPLVTFRQAHLDALAQWESAYRHKET